jgi:hypothetical protein
MQGEGTQIVTSGPAVFSVELDTATNVYAMDDSNWRNVNAGRDAQTVDSVHATRSPAVIRVPRAGRWWIVIEATGRPIRYGIKQIS